MKKEIQVYKIDTFHKIILDFVFPCERNKDFSIYGNLLVRLLSKKSKTYPTEEAFSNALVENYIMGFSFSKSTCGENWLYTFHVTLADNTVLKENDYDYKKTLQFLIKAIYEPYALKDSFYESEVEIAKNKLKTYIESGYKEIKSYASIRADEIVDEENYFFDSIFRHQEDIEKVTNTELFSHFKNVIQTKCPLVFAVGNINDTFIKTLENVLPKKEKTIFLPYSLKSFPTGKNIKTVKESKEYNQSILKFVYKVQNYTLEDTLKLNVLNFILSSQSSLVLQKFLRNREKLVYVAGSNFSHRYGLFTITAQIYREKYETTVKTIKEVMEKLLDSEFLSEKLEKVKMRKRINLERQKDDISCYLEDLEGTFFGVHETFVEEYKIINKITVEEMIAFLNRLQLDTIYYLEGSKDE